MAKISLSVYDAHASHSLDGLLTEGAVGIPIELSFSQEWDGLTKIVKAKCGDIVKDIPNPYNAVVPHECLIAGQTLYIGVYGYNDDKSIVIPTIWAEIGRVKRSASEPGTEPAPTPTPSQIEQVTTLAQNAARDAAAAADSAHDAEVSASDAWNAAKAAEGAAEESAAQAEAAARSAGESAREAGSAADAAAEARREAERSADYSAASAAQAQQAQEQAGRAENAASNAAESAANADSRAAAAVQSASASAVSAAGAAASASQSASEARSAQQAAAAAQTAAQDSAGSASNAAASAADAQSKANAAQSAASASAASAQTAAQSATAAQTSASNAETSARNAEESAANAATEAAKVTELKEDLTQLSESIGDISDVVLRNFTKNITPIKGGYLYIGSGNLSLTDDGYHTDYVRVEKPQKIKITTRISNQGCAVAFKDENGNYLREISIEGISTEQTVIIDMSDSVYDNVAFVATSGYGYKPTMLVYIGDEPTDLKKDVLHAVEKSERVIQPIDTSFFVGCNVFDADKAIYYNDRFTNGSVITVDGDSSSVSFEVRPNTRYSMFVPNRERHIVASSEKSTFLHNENVVKLDVVYGANNSFSFTTNADTKYVFIYVCPNKNYDWNTKKNEVKLYIGDYFTGDTPIIKKEYIPKDIDFPVHYNTFSIIGDSYSTFEGYLSHPNAGAWYPAHDGNEDTNDVSRLEQTWWYKFANGYGCRLLANNSWSGSTIGYDSYGTGLDDGKSSSFINRLDKEYIEKPELLLIFGGTNDEWASNDTGRTDFLGSYKYSNFTEADFIYFRPSLSHMLDELKKKNVGVKIVFILNNGLPKIRESVIEICNHYDVSLLQLDSITKKHSHPNDEGMTQISNQLTDFLNNL